LEPGLLEPEQLEQAIVDHKRLNMKLGQFLVREGIVNAAEIVNFVSKQLKIKKYQPDLYPFEMELANVVPIDFAQKYHLVPLQKSSYLLTVAMTDPTDIEPLDTLEIKLNTEIEPVICTDQELNNQIGMLYCTYSELGVVMVDVEYERE